MRSSGSCWPRWHCVLVSSYRSSGGYAPTTKRGGLIHRYGHVRFREAECPGGTRHPTLRRPAVDEGYSPLRSSTRARAREAGCRIGSTRSERCAASKIDRSGEVMLNSLNFDTSARACTRASVPIQDIAGHIGGEILDCFRTAVHTRKLRLSTRRRFDRRAMHTAGRSRLKGLSGFR